MSSSYKIAVVAACPFPYPRGTPIRILRMSEGLAALGHEVHVVTYPIGQDDEELPFAIHRIRNVPTYHKLSPGPSYQKLFLLDILLSRKLLSVVKAQKIDVIHAHHYEGLLAGLFASRLTGVPVVFDVHTLLATELPHYKLGLPAGVLRWLGQHLDHWLPFEPDQIVTVTNTVRDKLIDEIGVPAAKVTTVYTGIESEHFAAQMLTSQAPTPRMLVYAGNLAAYQGIDLMLESFRKVLDQRPDTILKIITDSQLAAYEKLIASLQLRDHIVVETGDYFQLPIKLHSAMIALNPRVDCDGLPVKLLNYMATGRAIVSFSGSAEILEHEQTGLVVPSGDTQAFASAIVKLLDHPDLARRLGMAAQTKVQEFFVWKSQVRLLERVYGDVLGRTW
jgi:glycosyltransferase involved in cell wall biosynthesis